MAGSQRECFAAMMKDVPDSDWPEYMRKLGFAENDFQQLYNKSSTSMSKYDMLMRWNQRAGIFNDNMNSILRGVADEVVNGRRDREVDICFGQLGVQNFVDAREKACFIYAFIQQYTDLDDWRKTVVRQTFKIKEHKLAHIEQNFKNNVQEQMFRCVYLFAQTNKLISTQQLIAQVKSLGLMIPPEYQADVVDAPEGDTEPLDLR